MCIGVSDDPKEAKRLKSQLEKEVGFGSGFMEFLDDIEGIVGTGTDKGYQRKSREFEVDSDNEGEGEDSDQSGFDGAVNDEDGLQADMQNDVDDEAEGEEQEEAEGQEEDQPDDVMQDEAEGEEQDEEVDEAEGEGEDEDEVEDEGEDEDEAEDEGNNQKVTKRQEEVDNSLEDAIRSQIHKTILSLLNKLSDGNMDVIFRSLHEELMKYSAYPEALAKVYFSVFKGFCIDTQMLNSAILSVNCLMITAFQRLLGQSFFAPIVNELYKLFIEAHKLIHGPPEHQGNSQIVLKNIISIFTHFYLFESITHTLISDVIKHLLKNFKEKDIEMLLNLLHNIGAIIRKDSPSLCKDIILLCENKKIEAKITTQAAAQPENQPAGIKNPLKPAESTQPTLTAFERKVKFLTEELNDIRNNKVSKHSKLLSSLKLYLNWLKTNSQVKSELLKAPLDVDFKTIQEAQNGQKWWLSDEDKQAYESVVKISEIEKKIDKSYLTELEAAAKAQHFATDIQKCVFYTLMSSDDYLDAFQNLQKLGLKKKQEREIIKVSLAYLFEH